ncbi:hypothetical protein [Propylenella binzhouense]|uniref:Uncharacterized protein n=1 Tax=Propylenella binzhouense TaxID=2555902 RepID=A0A964WSP5_9HYPH|nr:hypothetical protein [Propylenella binzhouense]MYZ47015.1 hypothetical protein [Propylenella binzhouense]
MQGNKTHEQFVRNLEHKSDVPKPGDPRPQDGAAGHGARHAHVRESEMPVSRGGMNQESRDHNKHNEGDRSVHGPQKHHAAEEKH